MLGWKTIKVSLVRIMIVASLFAAACATPPSQGSKEVSFASGKAPEGKVTEAQLQEELFRFANRFSANVRDGLSELERSPNPKLREQALLRRLMYDSAALDISLGPSPEANLLDMVAFVDLSKRVWDDYWGPQVFKEEGALMAQRFNQAGDEIWRIAGEVLNGQRRASLASLIGRWRRQNPDQISVENVRLSEFSTEAGVRAERMQSEVGGLLAAVQGATLVGDRALLFSERALFYAQRAPFLWRLQAKAGTRDVLTEAMTMLGSSERIAEQEPRLRAILGDMNMTLASMSRLLAQASGHPETTRSITDMVSHFAEALQGWNRILSNPRSKASPSQLAGIAGSIDAHASRILWRLFGLGCALILFLGLVSLVSRLAYRGLTRRYLRARRARAETSGGRRAA